MTKIVINDTSENSNVRFGLLAYGEFFVSRGTLFQKISILGIGMQHEVAKAVDTGTGLTVVIGPDVDVRLVERVDINYKLK